MRMMTKLFGIALTLIAFTAAGNAQNIRFVAIGSSALFLQAGLAASAPILSHGVGATCVWSQRSGVANSLQATDPTIAQAEAGNIWVAWTTGGGTCAAPGATSDIYAYLQTDSVIGNRCYSNGCTIGAMAGGNLPGSTPSGLISSSEVALPAAIWGALNGHVVTAAGTDIRPEDAEFATLRGTSYCGRAVTGGSQYLGLGYTSAGTPVESFYDNSTFHFVSFTLPSSYTVIPVGATPIVVGVNPSGSGFSSGVSNIDHTTLAKFLDGTFGLTGDLTGSAGNKPATVIIPEPLSGTYNAMEYAIPNSTSNTAGTGYDLQTSQDVGLKQLSAEVNCDSLGHPLQFPAGSGNFTMHIASNDSVGGAHGFRNRAIGTGQEVNELLITADSLGYAFWSTANFAAATSSNIKYLTVDGADPLYNPSSSTYATTKGHIPTSANGFLPDVTFTNLQDGTYPIWSLMRIVSSASGTTNYIYANKVATAAQFFISSTTRPDFVPFSNTSTTIAPLDVVHSHFAPPGYTGAVSNGSGSLKTTTGAFLAPNCSTTEAGGDVGGVIIGVGAVLPTGTPLMSENSYCAAGGAATAGQTGLRK